MKNRCEGPSGQREQLCEWPGTEGAGPESKPGWGEAVGVGRRCGCRDRQMQGLGVHSGVQCFMGQPPRGCRQGSSMSKFFFFFLNHTRSVSEMGYGVTWDLSSLGQVLSGSS